MKVIPLGTSSGKPTLRRNVSAMAGMVINLPNRLYRGERRADPVDEIRHEADPRSMFVMRDGA